MTEENKKSSKKEKYELKKDEKAQRKERAAKKKKMKSIAIWTVVAVLIAGSLWGIVRLAGNSEPQNVKLANEISENDWVKGSSEASVVLLEYGDFQCPACGAYYPLVKQLSEDFEDDLQVVFRHFPLRQIHPNAQLASQAAEAAGYQGKFWEMHDMLFENQNEWSNERNPENKFMEYAQTLGLDVERFEADMNSSEAEQKVNNDYNGGSLSGVQGTPTFFVNGEKIATPRNYDDFRAYIQQAIGQ